MKNGTGNGGFGGSADSSIAKSSEEGIVTIYETKKIDLSGAVVIDGFPSIGLVSTICANYLIDALKLEQIGTMESHYFPSVSMVRGGIPMSPARIYAGKSKEGGDTIAVFVSEFQPAPALVWPIAETMMKWAKEKKCRMIISPEGLVVEKPENVKVAVETEEVYGVPSSAGAASELVKNGVKVMANGIITGVSSALLNLSRRTDVDILAILAEVQPEYPNARAAARIIEAIDKILKYTEIDVSPLYVEAEKIEAALRTIQRQAEAMRKGAAPPLSIYA